MQLNPTPSTRFLNLLKNPNSSLEDVLSSYFFTRYWLNADESLITFIIQHYDELIEIGFQIKSESIYSIRCLQIMSSFNQNVRNRLFSETNILKFVYNYIFNISSYSHYSQKNYFYVLPNIMLDQFYRLNPIFDTKYFNELFNHIDNDYAYNFILRAITLAPFTVTRIMKKSEIEKTVILNFIPSNQKEKDRCKSKLLLFRNKSIFKEIAGTKLEGNSSEILCEKIDSIIQSAIENPTPEIFSFIEFIDDFSMKKFHFSKWKRVHLKIVPYFTTFCELLSILNSKLQFTSLSQSIFMLLIGIVSTTKKVTPSFLSVIQQMMVLFFELKTNTFLHNSCVKAFNLLSSIGELNSRFLDELNLFKIVTDCYEKNEVNSMISFIGQLRLISDIIGQFVANSKTVDLEKWNKFVVLNNKERENIMNKKFGGMAPINVNALMSPFLDYVYTPSFLSKNLYITENAPSKNSSPLS